MDMYIKGLEYFMCGNELWSQWTPRYRQWTSSCSSLEMPKNISCKGCAYWSKDVVFIRISYLVCYTTSFESYLTLVYLSGRFLNWHYSTVISRYITAARSIHVIINCVAVAWPWSWRMSSPSRVSSWTWSRKSWISGMWKKLRPLAYLSVQGVVSKQQYQDKE
jgi:hypothetical protein